MNRSRTRALGRGLEALIPMSPLESRAGSGPLEMVAVDQVRPSPQQMRKQFAGEPLRELADSIRAHGVLQPILVRRLPDGYELIAGERRWRAARIAGLERIPAIVRGGQVDLEQSLLLGLIENLQREDLDPVEEAHGIRRLIEQFGLTQEQAAARLGKHRVAIAQALRLLSGCPAVLSAAASGAISAGHARALVGLSSQEAQELGLKVVVGRQLSVRQTERWVRSYLPDIRRRRPEARPGAALTELGRDLSEVLAASVSVSGGRSRGRITITYSTPEQLESIVSKLAPGRL
jgi:ParB family chromosome partitioning protein